MSTTIPTRKSSLWLAAGRWQLSAGVWRAERVCSGNVIGEMVELQSMLGSAIRWSRMSGRARMGRRSMGAGVGRVAREMGRRRRGCWRSCLERHRTVVGRRIWSRVRYAQLLVWTLGGCTCPWSRVTVYRACKLLEVVPLMSEIITASNSPIHRHRRVTRPATGNARLNLGWLPVVVRVDSLGCAAAAAKLKFWSP